MDISATFCVAVLVLVGHASSLDVPASLWQPGREAVYRYEAAVQSWTMLPVETASQWQLRAKLTVQGDVNKATLQLSDVEVGVHNGAQEWGVPSDMTWGPIPEEAHHLSNSFSIQYVDEQPGRIAELLVKAGEDPWVVNMKRGVANLLQLDLNKVKEPAGTNMEEGLHGTCTVHYLVDEGHSTVRKHWDHARCVNFPSKYRGTDEKLYCHHQASLPQDRTSDSVVNYELGDHPFIKNIEAKGAINLQIFRANIDYHRIVTLQNLTLLEMREVKQPLVVKEGGEKVELRYEVPGKDVTLGRDKPSQEQLLKWVLKILENLSRNLEKNNLEVKPENLHEEQVAWVLFVLSTMEQPTLRKLYIVLEGSQGHQYMHVRKLFMELLPQIGSHDAALLVRDLVVARSVKNVTAIKFLYLLPFFVQNPTPELVQQLEVLVDDSHVNPMVHRTAILSFGTLIKKMCYTDCPFGLVEKYVQKYMEHITGSKDNYGDQMVYVQALGNIGHYKVLQYLKPLISDPGQCRHLRSFAIWAIKSVVRAHPLEAYELLMPILRNHTENLELRAAALTLLMISSPTVGSLSDLNWFMQTEEDIQLQNLWYTSLKSVAKSGHPCYSEMAEAARRIFRSLDEPKVDWLATGSYLVDYTNREYDFGAEMHMSIVTNPRTGQPNTFYFNYGAFEGQHRFADFGIYVRLEGINDYIRRQIFHISSKNIPKLKDLLKDLKLPEISSDELHFELSLMAEGSVIQTFYVNSENINEILQDLMMPLQAVGAGTTGTDYHAIDLVMSLNRGELLPTDIGTPAITGGVYSTISTYHVFSNVTNDVADVAHLHRILDLKSQMQAQSSLIAYNPVLNLWHVAKRSRTVQGKLPVEWFQTYDKNSSEITWTFQQTPGREAGFVWHVQSSTAVRGPVDRTKLEAHCPSCSKQAVAHTGAELPAQQSWIKMEVPNVGGVEVMLPQCEEVKDPEDLLLSLLDEDNVYINTESVPSAELSLMFLHMMELYILGPPTGSCGVAVKLYPPAQPSQVEMKMMLSIPRKFPAHLPAEAKYKHLAQMHIGHKEVGAAQIHPWIEVDVNMETEGTMESFTLDLKLPENNKVCLVTRIIRPDPSLKPELFSERNDGMKFLLGLKWGVMEQECSGSDSDVDVLELAVLAGHTEKQLALLREHNEGPYAECWQDLGGKPGQDVPPTAACTQVYKEQNTMRHFQVIVSHKNFIFIPYLEVPWLLYSLGDPEPRNLSTKGEVEMTLELPAEGNAMLMTRNYEVTLDDDTKDILESLLIDLQKVWKSESATHVNLADTCLVNVNGVVTFDSANNTDELPSCYTLAMADCVHEEGPNFAVFVKKMEAGGPKLGVKMYLAAHEVEIVSSEDKPVIKVNGTALEDPYTNESGLKIKTWQDASHKVEVSAHQYVPITVTYTGKSAVISTTGLFRGSLCGLCGDYDGNPHDDDSHQYKLQCE